MKKFYALFLFIFIAFSFFAQDNNENPDESYYQLETKYFQIIYKKESIHTAKLLYENVDNFYEEITEKIDAKSDFFLPILIRSDIQALNAYFTFFPYDHIVIYDTVVDDLSLAVFSETLLSVFYHELTHAISLKSGHNSINLLNIPFIEVPNTLLTSPTSFSEGATVSFESSTGEGRLNSGYSLSVLLQAKLEDCFPDWKEASGANDKYRIGDYPYIFGGAFHKYLQEKYGMEKYKAFWNELNKRLLTESAFKKVYNTSLTKEWSLFKESIPTIEVEEDSGNIEVSKRKKINSFDATDNLIVYYSSSDRAINIIKDEKEKKLLNAQSVVNLKLSSDEKYLAITKLSNLYAYETFIYDLENEKYLKNNFSSFRNPIFASYQGRKLIIGLSSEQNKQTIQYFYLDEDENTKNKEKDNDKTNDNEESKWIYFSDIEILDIAENQYNQTFSVLGKNKDNWFIADVSLEKFTEKPNVEEFFQNVIKLPNNIIPLSLNTVNQNEKIISYVEKNYSLSRVAKIIDDKIFYQTKDISGGILNPIKTASGYVYLSNMLKYSTVSFVKDIPGGYSDSTKLQNYTGTLNSVLAMDVKTEKSSEIYKLINETATKYSDFKHLDKTVVIPLLSTLDIPANNLLSTDTVLPLPGIDLIWQNPLETKIFGLGVGYLGDFLNAHASYTVPALSFVVGGMWTKSGSQYVLANIDLSAAFNLQIGLTKWDSNLGLNGCILFNYDKNLDLTITQNYYVDYSFLKGFWEIGFLTMSSKEIGKIYNPSFICGYKIPKLLPFDSPVDYTLNLPLTLMLGISPDFISFLSFNGSLNLFAKEIHQSIPFIPLYVNRFGIDCGYFLNFQNKSIENFSINRFKEKIFDLRKETDFIHGFSSSMYFDLTPVVGFLVNTKPRFSVDFTYYLENPNANRTKPYEITIAGMFTF